MAPLSQCALSKNNIHTWGKAIFDAYKSEKNSLFSVIVDSPYWRKMLDWVSKFNTEFKWIYIQGVHPDTWKPFLLPTASEKMKDGVTAYDLVESLFEMTGLYINIKENTLNSWKILH